MKVILHIGPHKTGSTAIQRTLHRNSALLTKNQFYYGSATPDHYNHHAFAMEFRKGPKEKEWPTGALHPQIVQAAEAGCHTCNFSSEMYTKNPDIALVREIFAGHAL
jgi:hypothetical protein